MQWQESLKEGIRKALESGQFHMIALHHPEQQLLAQDFAFIIASELQRHPLQIEFTVLPDSVRDIFPVGFLDPDF